MKKIRLIGMGLLLTALFAGIRSCDPKEVEAGFEDLIGKSIFDYLVENDSSYSSFLSILEAGGIDKTMSAYNPDGYGYTLFLPDNQAIHEFILKTDRFASLDDLLADSEFVQAFSRYHVVNLAIKSDNFPFGALPEFTLSGDILTVSFVIEPDTSYYKINNQAPVTELNIEMSNGFIHIISSALEPVTSTTYEWMENHEGYSLFKEAVDATGLKEMFDLNARLEDADDPFTLLMEHDSVFNSRGIFSFQQLAAWISPDDDNYGEPSNPLYGFVSYHMIEQSYFLDDFADYSSNYATRSEIPVHVNGLGLDILVNPGKEVFDTIISGVDTTIINYIGFDYDNSNVLTQSGAIHFIDQVLRQVAPNTATQSYEFWDEPLFNEFRQTPGDYLVEDTASLYHFTWWGADLTFVETGDAEHPAWGGDYIFMDGDFIIQYEVPKIVKGIYTVEMRVENVAGTNALVETYIDGKKVGGLFDLSTGGNPSYPFAWIELGTINFVKYESHIFEVRTLIPGTFSWDVLRFTPYVKE